MNCRTEADGDIRYELVAESSRDLLPESPLHRIRRALRARYRLLFILALVFASAGAVIGYNAVPPKYESTGIVRIESALPAILYPTQEHEIPPAFDAYVASQATYLQSRAVLDEAVATPEMRAGGWASGSEGRATLYDALSVYRRRGEQVISVTVRHADPRMAQTAAHAVLDVFQQSPLTSEGLSPPEMVQVLVQREAGLEKELVHLREKILEVSNQYGQEAINQMYVAKVEELVAIDRRLRDLRIARSGLVAGGDGDEAVDVRLSRSANGRLSSLKEQELALVARVKGLETNYSPDHPMIRSLRREIEVLRIQQELRNSELASPRGTVVDAPNAPNWPESLESRFEQMQQRIRQEAALLGTRQISLAGLHEQETEVQGRLTETRGRLDELRLEVDRDGLSRVRVISRADLPTAAVSDRRLGLMIAGALLGVFGGLTVVFVIGICDRRVRFMEDLDALDLPIQITGLLPEIDNGDPMIEGGAARCIHQIRNVIELQSDDASLKTFAITSSGYGEGKTSVALGLGASFASAGRRTLLIDADVARSALSHELGVEDAPGLSEAVSPSAGSFEALRTPQENLWVMPIGNGRELDPEVLSHGRFKRLLDDLRSGFDVILIDTGPILASVEACLVSAIADRVIVVVARYQADRLVQGSLARLERVGANCLGVVFNRAARSDFRGAESADRPDTSHVVPFVPLRGGERGSPSMSLSDYSEVSTGGRSEGKGAA